MIHSERYRHIQSTESSMYMYISVHNQVIRGNSWLIMVTVGSILSSRVE